MHFHCEGGQTPERVSQDGLHISILEDIQNPADHVPGQPALGDLVRAGVWTRQLPAKLSLSVTRRRLGKKLFLPSKHSCKFMVTYGKPQFKVVNRTHMKY